MGVFLSQYMHERAIDSTKDDSKHDVDIEVYKTYHGRRKNRYSITHIRSTYSENGEHVFLRGREIFSRRSRQGLWTYVFGIPMVFSMLLLFFAISTFCFLLFAIFIGGALNTANIFFVSVSGGISILLILTCLVTCVGGNISSYAYLKKNVDDIRKETDEKIDDLIFEHNTNNQNGYRQQPTQQNHHPNGNIYHPPNHMNHHHPQNNQMVHNQQINLLPNQHMIQNQHMMPNQPMMKNQISVQGYNNNNQMMMQNQMMQSQMMNQNNQSKESNAPTFFK